MKNENVLYIKWGYKNKWKYYIIFVYMLILRKNLVILNININIYLN